MKRLWLLLAVLGWFVFQPVHAAHAQAAVVTASYSAGWNMVGGPQGTDLSAAAYLDLYSNGAYSSPASKVTTPCAGYWAYFDNPTSLTLTSTSVGPVMNCALQPGWNLVGNPFAGGAQVPSGVTAYWWNPDKSTYDVVTTIPPGGAVWVNATNTTNLPLTYVPVTTGVPVTVTIDPTAGLGPYTVHVGDSIKLIVPSATSFQVQVDPNYLHLETAGVTGPMSCLNPNDATTCAITLVNRFWIYKAIAAGQTVITFSPACLSSKPPCAVPSFAVELTINP